MASKNLKAEDALANSSLIKGFENLRCRKELIDVVLLCNGGNLEAHRFVLFAQSAFFRKMFSADFKESKNNEIDLSHMKVDIVQSILDYIYTNSTDRISQLPIDDVLQALQSAHMFELDPLTDHCWQIIVNSLSIKNCFVIWNAALLYRGEGDKEIIMEFVLENLKEIHEQNKFNDLTPAQINLLLDKIKRDNIVVGNFFLQAVFGFNLNGKLTMQELENFLIKQNLDYISKELLTQLLDREKSNLSDEFFRRLVETQVLPRLKTNNELAINPPKYSSKTFKWTTPVKILRFSCDKKIDNGYIFNENVCLEIVDFNTGTIETRKDLPFLFGYDVFLPIQHHKRVFFLGCTSKSTLRKISNRSFISFDWKENDVIRVSSPPRSFLNPLTCAVGETIYLVSRSNPVTQAYCCCSSNIACWKYIELLDKGLFINCVNYDSILHLLCLIDSSCILYKYSQGKIVEITEVPLPISDKLLMTVYKGKIFIFYLSDIPRLSRCSAYDSKTKNWTMETFHGCTDTSRNPHLKIAAAFEEGILFSESRNNSTNFYIYKGEGDGTLKFIKTDKSTWKSDLSLAKHGFSKFQHEIVLVDIQKDKVVNLRKQQISWRGFGIDKNYQFIV